MAGPLLAQLDGDLRVQRRFYAGREGYKTGNATLVGFMDFDPAHQRIESLVLVTEKATYGTEGFGAALTGYRLARAAQPVSEDYLRAPRCRFFRADWRRLVLRRFGFEMLKVPLPRYSAW